MIIRSSGKALGHCFKPSRILRSSAKPATGFQAVRLVEQRKPHVLVADLMMPGLNGLEVARQVTQRCPRTRIVVLSMHANEAYVLEALKNGACAYVLKDASAVDLVRAVREALAGRRYLSPPLSEPAIESYIQRARLREFGLVRHFDQS
jgi:two-component system response regulator NreC